MKEAVEKIFESVLSDVQKNLNDHAAGRLPDSSKPPAFQGSGHEHFKFHLDANGNAHYELEKYGAGITVHLNFWINDPAATYTITIWCSDGGGGHWENVKPGQQLKCDIRTAFTHSTKVKADIHATVKNVDGSGEIDYHY